MAIVNSFPWVARALKTFRLTMAVLQIALIVFALALVVATFALPGVRWLDFAGGYLFVIAVCTMVITILLVFVFSGAGGRLNSIADIAFVWQYLRAAPRTYLAILVTVLAVALGLEIMFETSGVANASVAIIHGQHVRLGLGEPTRISLSQFNRMSAARNIWYPVGAAMFFLGWQLTLVLADSKQEKNDTRTI